MSDPAIRELARVALEIGEQRAKVMDRLKRALEAGNDAEALRLARVLTGLEEDAEEAT